MLMLNSQQYPLSLNLSNTEQDIVIFLSTEGRIYLNSLYLLPRYREPDIKAIHLRSQL